MKFEGTEIKGTFEVREEIFYFGVWQGGNLIYRQFKDGFWAKYEYDDNGKEIYYENSNGKIVDNRPKTTKVFRLWKYLSNEETLSELKIATIKIGWPQECEGLTQEEMRNLGYLIDYSWFVEEEN